jgi:beta-glucosidase
VIQLYIAANEQTSSIQRAKKELKGFTKVFLQPGETRRVKIDLDKFAVAFWDELLNRWVNEKGKYEVLIGRSSQDIVLKGFYNVLKTTTWSGL